VAHDSNESGKTRTLRAALHDASLHAASSYATSGAENSRHRVAAPLLLLNQRMCDSIRGCAMKYLIAWMLGVPGEVILLWMLANTAC
jgi:hypothetical protein